MTQAGNLPLRCCGAGSLQKAVEATFFSWTRFLSLTGREGNQKNEPLKSDKLLCDRVQEKERGKFFFGRMLRQGGITS